jgi:hypothetical protein
MTRNVWNLLAILLIPGLAFAGIENPQPGSTQSGIGLISGWTCAPATITYSIDSGPTAGIPFGGSRADTAASCGGQANNGFGLLFNYNTLSKGQHTLQVFANGTMLGQVAFTATNTGGEFQSGLTGRRYLNNFPTGGTRTIVEWQQEKQNFSIVGQDTTYGPISGTYIGAQMFSRSGCPANGSFTEAGTITVSQGSTTTTIVTQSASGSCTTRGQLVYLFDGGDLALQNATINCTDGSSGTVSVPRIYVTPHGFTYEFSESLGSCHLSGRGGGLRQ